MIGSSHLKNGLLLNDTDAVISTYAHQRAGRVRVETSEFRQLQVVGDHATLLVALLVLVPNGVKWSGDKCWCPYMHLNQQLINRCSLFSVLLIVRTYWSTRWGRWRMVKCGPGRLIDLNRLQTNLAPTTNLQQCHVSFFLNCPFTTHTTPAIKV